MRISHRVTDMTLHTYAHCARYPPMVTHPWALVQTALCTSGPQGMMGQVAKRLFISWWLRQPSLSWGGKIYKWANAYENYWEIHQMHACTSSNFWKSAAKKWYPWCVSSVVHPGGTRKLGKTSITVNHGLTLKRRRRHSLWSHVLHAEFKIIIVTKLPEDGPRGFVSPPLDEECVKE